MGSDQVIYFRADGNSEIATGHLVRCLSIARALRYELAKPAGPCCDICFLVSDGESRELLNGFFDFPEEFAIRILEAGSYDAPMTELPQSNQNMKRGIPRRHSFSGRCAFFRRRSHEKSSLLGCF